MGTGIEALPDYRHLVTVDGVAVLALKACQTVRDHSLGNSSLHQPKAVVLLDNDRRRTGACYTVFQRDMS